MFRWLRHQRVVDRERELELDRLKQELDDERAAIVVVECAVKPICVAKVQRLEAENELLRSKLGEGLDE